VEGETLPGSSGGQQAPGPAGGESEEKTCVPFSSAAGARGKPRRERSGALEALMLVLSAFLLALTLKTYVAEAYEIKGRSMEETFSDGQRVVVLKAFYALQRGDIVVFASSEDPGKDLIKRVVGLPGEVVQIRRGGVYINGKRLEEDYLKPNARGRYETTREPVRLDPNCYYVLGDNRPDSHDSRYFGEVPKGSIKGKVVVRWWPFSMFKSF
jgi:signal peptidase I